MLRRPDRHIQSHQPPQQGGDAGNARVEVGRVGEDHGVGLQNLPVTPQESFEVGRADLLLPFHDQPHVQGQAAGCLQAGRRGCRVHDDSCLVVGRAAAVEPAASLRRRKGRRFPEFQPAGRLDVMMGVKKQRRGSRRVEPVSVDVGMGALEAEDLDVLEPARRE